MEDNKVLNRLELLEQGIEQILNGYNALQRDKKTLESLIESKDHEISSLKQTITELNEDKNSTLLRVSGLLSSIEAWEESQTSPETPVDLQQENEEQTGEEHTATLGDPQPSMRSMNR